MRASRLLSILMLLQTRGRMSATTLARELEVSVRTILRDIDQLSAAGVPVWSDRGREGGFQLKVGWSTDLTGLTSSEADALLLAGLPSAATELGLGSASASARLKMLSAVPVALRENALRVSERLHIDPVDWYRAATPPTHLRAVANAVWQQRMLSIRYESWTSTKHRTIRPLGLVLKAGIWYVVALADESTAPRTYRLSNIQSLEVQKGSFRFPRKFNLATYWEASTARFEQEIYQGVATVRVTARGLKLLKEMSTAVREAATKSAVPDGERAQWHRVTIPIESEEYAAHQLLSIGADLEVLTPASLRSQIIQLLQAIAKRYAA